MQSDGGDLKVAVVVFEDLLGVVTVLGVSR